MSHRIVCVGHNTVDKYVVQHMMYPGGNEVNVAVHTARHGLESSYVGCLGNDDYGHLILKALQAEEVNTSHAHVMDDVNTYTEIFLEDGERTFGNVRRGASTRCTLTENDYNFIRSHDLLFTSYYSRMEAFLREKPENLLVCFDFTELASKSYLEEFLPLVDIAIIPLEQEVDDVEVLLKSYKAMGANILLVTMGSRGAFLYHEQLHFSPSLKGEVLDTLGAGDAFIARFVTEYLQETELSECMKRATQSAYETCMHYGAFGHGAKIPEND